ncbi:MAG: M23 family metallopeptidase [Chitinophagaceae bacterium]|nr:M23 family metallopeptidase [Chitinophagaceae bacterium]
MKRPDLHIAVFLFCFIAIFACLPGNVSGQTAEKYPKNYFRWPLNIKPEIVANLGELRSNHWHMGLDMRTARKENLQVYAAAAGYISKIRVEKFGFGRCIWITHPNGYTTLYAHLNNFFPALEQYVTEQQYKQETWAIELEFSKEKFPVSKGQFIAYSGNTGGSQGPHVHFEIRDTKTEECINPMLFGMPLPDNVKPSLLKLALYDRSRSIYEQSAQIFPLRNTDSGYIIYKTPVLRTGLARLSFGLQAIDKISGASNENGIYSARVFFDEQPVIGFMLERISYAGTRYMNAHIDYKYRFNGGPYFQNLFQLPGDHSSVYYHESGDGVIRLADTAIHTVRVEVKDANGNTSQLRFMLQYDDKLVRPAAVMQSQQFTPNYVSLLEKPGFEIYLPETCLYDSVHSFYYRNNSFSGNAVSAVHQVNEASVPVHSELTVRIKPDRAIGAEVKDKIIIQRTFRNSTDITKAIWEGEWMSARFRDFGFFQAFIDEEPPVINELGKGDTIDLSPVKRIVFTPTDNSGVKNFRAELNGEWLRFTNDKGRNHIYNFDERCPYGVYQLTVTVEDIVGNATTKTWWFKRYPYIPPKKKVTKKKTVSKKPAVKKKVTTKKK